MEHARPIILTEGSYTDSDLIRLRASYPIWKEQDMYQGQLAELFEITHAELINDPAFANKRADFILQCLNGTDGKLLGNWIYYPWSGRLVHTVTEAEYLALRTNRNRNLITAEEQETIRAFRVGAVGLSVGSGVATALAYSGMAKQIKLAEFDTLETSNLNRIRARIDQIGQRKIGIVAEQIYEIDPYAELSFMTAGLQPEVLSEFVLGDPKPQLIFEIIDSFAMKIYLRQMAREARIPVIMVTNIGDRVILDVERYDCDPNTPFFNGRAGQVPNDILTSPDLSTTDKHKYAVALAGVSHIPQRALDSVAEIGKTLVGRPQLVSTVTIASGFCAYLARRIALNDPVQGSWLVSFDDIFSLNTRL